MPGGIEGQRAPLGEPLQDLRVGKAVTISIADRK